MLNAVAQWLYQPDGLTPHGFCLLWEPGLLWAHAASDVAIALAYFSIPAVLAVVAKRRQDLMFRPLFWLFAAFILLCGAEHLSEVLTLWVPAYGLQAVIKVATASVSIVTAVLLWRLLPQALALPSPEKLRQAADALRASEARHRVSFERSPVPVCTLDHEGRITGVSESWLALLGYKVDEVLGLPVDDLSVGQWSEVDAERLRVEGEFRDIERHFIRNDGTVVETLVSARLEQASGAGWAIYVLIDISARRRVEKALRASEERLNQAQKMEAVGQLTGGIAHDFNNMLQAIVGGLDLMEQEIRQGRPQNAEHFLAVARQSAGHAARLTHRLLAFARRQALRPRALDPATLILGMEEIIRRTLGPSVRLVLRLHGAQWQALCDANQLESALLNLAINARDAMPDGGVLTICQADRTLGPGDLPGQPDLEPGEYVEIAVTDTGTGMPPEVLARAFEPFFTTKPTGQGTGLGLSQIYGFARQSGGAVQLESTPGQGTTVLLYLPRNVARPQFADRPTLPMLPAKPVRGTVLLVEDEENVRMLIVAALEGAGCEVIQAKDGPSGLAIVQSRTKLDLLVTDVGLPGLNGRQLAEAAQQARSGLPVLLITGYAGSALEQMELPPGMAVLHKPFALQSLLVQVKAMLDMEVSVVE